METNNNNTSRAAIITVQVTPNTRAIWVEVIIMATTCKEE